MSESILVTLLTSTIGVLAGVIGYLFRENSKLQADLKTLLLAQVSDLKSINERTGSAMAVMGNAMEGLKDKIQAGKREL